MADGDNAWTFEPGTKWSVVSGKQGWNDAAGNFHRWDDKSYWNPILDDARTVYGDPGIHYNMDKVVGGNRQLLFSDGRPLPTDGTVVYHQANSDNYWIQNKDGTVTPATVEFKHGGHGGNYETVPGDPIAPAGYREIDGKFAPVDRSGEQVGPQVPKPPSDTHYDPDSKLFVPANSDGPLPKAPPPPADKPGETDNHPGGVPPADKPSPDKPSDKKPTDSEPGEKGDNKIPPEEKKPTDNADDDSQSGDHIEAIKKLEEKLKNNAASTAADDSDLATLVLQAQTKTQEGRNKLSNIQKQIDDAVKNATYLDTPAGAREFHRWLLGKSKDIFDAVENADLDNETKTNILRGLYRLNTASKSDGPAADEDSKNDKDGGDDKGSTEDKGTPGTNPPGTNDAALLGAQPTDPLADLLGDPGLMDDSGLFGPDSAAPGLPQMPMPTMPGVPNLGGGFPSLGGQPGSALSDLLKPQSSGDDDPLRSLLDDPLLDGPPADQLGENSLLDGDGDGDGDGDDDTDKKTDNEKPSPEPGDPVPATLSPPMPPGTGPTEVTLPDGTTVTAPSPQYADITKDIVEGKPISEAFRNHGGTSVVPPGTAVTNPMDPSKITMGAIGQYTDHQIYALSKDLAVINGQIRPITDAQGGPGFLGWIPPPEIPDAPLRPATAVTEQVAATAQAPPAPAAPAAPAAAAPSETTSLLTPQN